MTEPTTPSDEPTRPPRRTRRPRPSAAAGVPRPQSDETPGGDDAATAKPRRGTDRKVKESLVTTYQTVGMLTVASAMAREDDALVAFGTAVTSRAEAAADAWLELADQNPAVKAALIKFTQGSAVANLAAVHLSMVFPLLAARGVIPPIVAGAFGYTAPSQNGDTPA